MENFNPGRRSGQQAPLSLAIGESCQSSQMTPIGAGPISPIQTGQLSADFGSDGRFQWLSAHPYPGLEMAGTGFNQHTGLVIIRPHGVEDGRVGVVQIDKNIAGVVLRPPRVEIDVVSLAIAGTQKSHGGAIGHLGSGPKTIPRKNFSGVAVNQPDEINIAGHRRQLPSNSLQCEEESAIHDRDSTTHSKSNPAKAEFSTLLKSGTFYFALTLS